MKTCGKCGRSLPLKEFNTNKSKKDGYQSMCKRCQAEYRKSWYKKNKTSHRKNVGKNNAARRELYTRRIVAYLLAHPCVDCGETDPLVLDFDHVRGKKVMGLSTIYHRLPAWHRVEAELAKCEVRCAKCHRRKSAIERGDLRVKILQEMGLPC